MRALLYKRYKFVKNEHARYKLEHFSIDNAPRYLYKRSKSVKNENAQYTLERYERYIKRNQKECRKSLGCALYIRCALYTEKYGILKNLLPPLASVQVQQFIFLCHLNRHSHFPYLMYVLFL
jgi:hypothetical protein